MVVLAVSLLGRVDGSRAAGVIGNIERFAGGPGFGSATELDMAAGGLTAAGGDLYLTDTFWNVARRIDLATGDTTVAAGNGTHNYSGDWGPSGDGGRATDAPLYLGDWRAVVVNGETLPDGYGITGDLAVGPDGDLFVVDVNRRIRRIDAATGIISSYAGTGYAGWNAESDGQSAASAKIGTPHGLVVDAGGNVYFTEYYEHRVRRIDAATGVLTTVVGTGVAGFSGDGGPAAQAQLNYPQKLALDGAGNLFVADMENHRIRKVDLTGGVITTVAGNGSPAAPTGSRAPDTAFDGLAATSAQVTWPVGLDVDPAGNIYISQPYSFLVRKVDASDGTISTLAGGAVGGYAGDGGPSGSSQLYLPYDVEFDDGLLYIADYGNRRVRVIDAAGVIDTMAGNGALAFSGDGGPADHAQMFSPSAVTVARSGDVLIADQSNHRVRRVDAQTGVITTVAGNGKVGFGPTGGPATEASLYLPAGVALDSQENIYISDWGNSVVLRVDAVTNVVEVYAGIPKTAGGNSDGLPATSARIGNPWGLVFDSKDNLYFADDRNAVSCRVRKVDAETKTMSTVAGNNGNCTSAYGDGGPATASGLQAPRDVAVDSKDNLYIADRNTDQIRMIDAATGIITTAMRGPFIFPFSVTLDPADNLYVTDLNHRVFMRNKQTGAVTRMIGTYNMYGGTGDGGPAQNAFVRSVDDLAIDPRGFLYLAEKSNFRVRRIALDPAAINVVPPPMVDAPAEGVTVAPGPVTMTGSAPVGTTIGIDEGTGRLGTAATGTDGRWSFVAAFAPGPHTVVATATNAQGRQSASTYRSFTAPADATPPDVPIITTPGEGSAVATASVPIGGTAEPWAVVKVREGSTLFGSATADPSGNWSVSPVLGDGGHEITATATDAAGNSSPVTPARAFTVSATPPGAPMIQAPAHGTASSASSLTVAGTAVAAASVEITEGATALRTVTADAAGAWSTDVSFADGAHTITATATDGFGRVGPASAPRTFTVDTAAPAAPEVTTPVQAATLTDSWVVASGTAEPRAIVTVREGARILGTVSADASGAWSVATGLANGPHTLTATATDAAGNVSAPSVERSFDVADTVAPAIPTITAPAQSSSVDASLVVVSGSAEPGGTVALREGATVLGTTPVNAAGAWRHVLWGLTSGQRTITATATDPAGNAGDPSDARTFTVVAATAQGLRIASPGPDSVQPGTVAFSGAGAKVGTAVALTEGALTLGTVMPASDGTWTMGLRMPTGAHTVTATSTSTGIAASAPLRFVVDADPPAVAVTTAQRTLFLPGDPARIAGTASDNRGVVAVWVTYLDAFSNQVLKQRATCACAPGATQVGWTSEPTLPRGSYTAVAQSVDEAGNISPVRTTTFVTIT